MSKSQQFVYRFSMSSSDGLLQWGQAAARLRKQEEKHEKSIGIDHDCADACLLVGGLWRACCIHHTRSFLIGGS
jgi:hypothetical protein